MPTYDYKCLVCLTTEELIHPIIDCDIVHVCDKCGIGVMKRQIPKSQHIEGRGIYPFDFWNIRTPDGKNSMTIKNKSEHKKVLYDKGLDSPYFHVGG